MQSSPVGVGHNVSVALHISGKFHHLRRSGYFSIVLFLALILSFAFPRLVVPVERLPMVQVPHLRGHHPMILSLGRRRIAVAMSGLPGTMVL